jgi:coenzyme F420-0:L-glutamate ligase/coenzyme F420-1:gamma-L-glutamate ligase
MARLEVMTLDAFPEVGTGDDLALLIEAALQASDLELQDGDVVAVAQKIVSKAEGRAVNLASVLPSGPALGLAQNTGKDARLVELILRESVAAGGAVVRIRPGLIIVEDSRGLVLANAGIDASNVPESEDGKVLLLPIDPDRSAALLRAALEAATGCRLAVVILDSIGRAWRLGTVGTAIGCSGLPALLDLRGSVDRNGRTLQATEIGLADEVAAAASLMIGQAAEGTPVALLRGVPYGRTEGRARSLQRPKSMDLFR